MADTVIVAKNGSAVFNKIMKKLQHARGAAALNSIKKRCWWAAGVPAVDIGSQAAYPVALNDFAYDNTNDDAYICTVAPTAATAATFVKLNA